VERHERTMKTLRWEGYYLPKNWIQFVLFLSFLIASAVRWNYSLPEEANSLLEEANSFPEEANVSSVGRNYFLPANVSFAERNYSLPKEANVTSVGRNSFLPVKYGFVHMARSGGSVINHLLALKYERVCGNKGYSHNENKINENRRRRYSNLTALDIANQKKRTSKTLHRANRNEKRIRKYAGRTAFTIANRNENRRRKKKRLSNSTHRANALAIANQKGSGSRSVREVFDGKSLSEALQRGFDDCDYIAMEVESNTWRKLAGHLHRPLELHIPCREPIDHLMSMCAFQYKNFHCDVTNKELQIQVDDCIFHNLNRFSMDMAPSPNVTMKCFSSPSKIDDYIEYMGKTLQKKQIQGEYFDMISNKWPRHKETECIRENVNKGLRKRLEKILLNHKSQYFKYCKDCIGSENDLLR